MAYNLQGIIRKASTNMITEFDRLAYATQNFANINTNGYKAVRFEDVLMQMDPCTELSELTLEQGNF